MTIKQRLRIMLDIAMIALLLFAYNPRFAREGTHIFIGITIFIFFTIHIFMNRHWFTSIFKNTYTPRRIFLTAINVLLVLAAATMILTGILEESWKPSFSVFESGITIREIHTIAAYWFLPVAGIHLGLHWGMIANRICKNHFIIITARILAVLFTALGIWSFFDRDMFSKMFLGFSFSYWPQEKPIVLFYAQTLSIIGVFVITTHYLLKLITWLKTINKKQQTEVL